MIAFIVRRLAVSFLVMALVSFLTFGIIWLVPGDAASVFLDTSATPEQLEQIRRRLGLDQPFHVQMMSWYSRVLQGDSGTPYSYSAACWRRSPNACRSPSRYLPSHWSLPRCWE